MGRPVPICKGMYLSVFAPDRCGAAASQWND